MDTDAIQFPTLYDRFRPSILRYLTSMVGDYEAEDLAQEVFVKVNRGLATFRGDAKISTWIYRIATNTALDRLRRTPSSPHCSLDQPVLISNEDNEQGEWAQGLTNEEDCAVDLHVIRQEMTDCIRSYVGRIPQDHRVVLVLSEYEGFSNQEIARILGISLDNVKIRLHRARTRLRAELKTGCNFYHDERNVLSCEARETVDRL